MKVIQLFGQEGSFTKEKGPLSQDWMGLMTESFCHLFQDFYITITFESLYKKKALPSFLSETDGP